jgi:predicted enzyme related to lactoylglutathione lyase
MTDRTAGEATPFQINIVVADMDRALAFYRLLGWEPRVTGPHASLSFDNGFTVDFDTQEFAQHWNHAAPPLAPGSIVLNLMMGEREAVDAAWQRLVDAGHDGRQAPYDAFWGARYAIVADPDGYQIGLMSRSSDDHRSSPP